MLQNFKLKIIVKQYNDACSRTRKGGETGGVSLSKEPVRFILICAMYVLQNYIETCFSSTTEKSLLVYDCLTAL